MKMKMVLVTNLDAIAPRQLRFVWKGASIVQSPVAWDDRMG